MSWAKVTNSMSVLKSARFSLTIVGSCVLYRPFRIPYLSSGAWEALSDSQKILGQRLDIRHRTSVQKFASFLDVTPHEMSFFEPKIGLGAVSSKGSDWNRFRIAVQKRGSFQLIRLTNTHIQIEKVLSL
jgi:hypothetical protein